MNEKVKNSQNQSKNDGKSFLIRVGLVLSVCCFFLAVGIVHLYGSELWARMQVSRLRFTRLPDDAEIISFDVKPLCGSECGTMIARWLFRSDMHEESLLEFFNYDSFSWCGLSYTEENNLRTYVLYKCVDFQGAFE